MVDEIKEDIVKPKGKKNFFVWFFIIILVVAGIVFSINLLSKNNDAVPVVENNTGVVVVEDNLVNPSITVDVVGKNCGDGWCDMTENYGSCPSDCISGCGDGVIVDGDGKTTKNCIVDILSKCGNGVCDSWEHYRYCSQDCSECIVDDFGKYDGVDKCPPSPRWEP